MQNRTWETERASPVHKVRCRYDSTGRLRDEMGSLDSTALLALYVGSYELGGKLSFICETKVRTYGSVNAGQIFVPAVWIEAKATVMLSSSTFAIHRLH